MAEKSIFTTQFINQLKMNHIFMFTTDGGNPLGTDE